MKKKESKTFRLKIWGDWACFTRPEMKVERVSYEVISPSAARGVFDAIFWKPAILWQVDQIDILQEIQWTTVRRNEITDVVSSRTRAKALAGEPTGIFIEDCRTQRASLLLRNVCYVVHAKFILTERLGDAENVIKFEEMFSRRASKGQYFHAPYLGCREFPAAFELLKEHEIVTPLPIDRNLGLMLHDIRLAADGSYQPYFFQAIVEQGSIHVPAVPGQEVKI